MTGDRYVFRKMVDARTHGSPGAQAGVEVPEGEVLAMVTMRAMGRAGERGARTRVSAFERVLEKRLGLERYAVGSYLTSGTENPTLYHHGAGPARWHVVSMPGNGAVADLYFTDLEQAASAAQHLSDVLGVKLALLSNKGTPKRLSAHARITRGLSGPSGYRPKRNPAEPVAGQVWSRPGGGRVRVLAVTRMQVEVLDSVSGNRERIDRKEFAAVYRLQAGRGKVNPKRRAKSYRPVGEYRGGAGIMPITPYYATEFARAAAAMYKRRQNRLGHLLSAAAALREVPIAQFDRAAEAYRKWLVFDEPKGPEDNPARSKAARGRRGKTYAFRRQVGRRAYRAAVKSVRRPAKPGNAAQAIHYLHESQRRASGNPKGRPRGWPVPIGGGWAVASAKEKAGSIDIGETTQADWEQWYRDATGLEPPKARKSAKRPQARYRVRKDTMAGATVWEVYDSQDRDHVVLRSYKERDARNEAAYRNKFGVTKNPRRRSNPRPFEDAARRRAEKMFETWHEFGSSNIKRVKLPSGTLPKYGVKLGEVVTIDYVSDKWEGKPVTYTHDTKRPRPWLVTDPDGRQLFLVGGKMRPTADGLVN